MCGGGEGDTRTADLDMSYHVYDGLSEVIVVHAKARAHCAGGVCRDTGGWEGGEEMMQLIMSESSAAPVCTCAFAIAGAFAGACVHVCVCVRV
jgi:hypothetical protein